MKKRIVRLVLPVILAIGAVGILMVGYGYAATIAIDTFDVGVEIGGNEYSAVVCDRADMDGCEIYVPPPVHLTYTIPNSDSFRVTTVLGGERDMIVTHTTGGGDVEFRVDANNRNVLDVSQVSATAGRGQIQWDGIDGSPLLDNIGLGGLDLTDSGTNDGFQLHLGFSDGDFDLVLSVYTGTNSSSYTLNLTDPIAAPGRIFLLPFDDFTVVDGSGADFSSVGAVVLDIDPQGLGVDLAIDLLETTPYQMDWGDLPDTYSTTLSTDGARHIITDTSALYLGSQVDLETDGLPSPDAEGDNNDNLNDEQGVIEAATDPVDNSGWVNGANGGAITVTVGGSSGCLSGWLDWGEDGNFDAIDDHIINHQPVGVGDNLVTFNVPDNTFGGTDYTYGFYTRIRIYPDTGVPGCSDESVDYFGLVNGGEIEEYYWEYDRPTAITLTTMEATNNSLAIIAAAVALLILLFGGVLFVYKR